MLRTAPVGGNNKKQANLKDSGCESGPAHHQPEERRSRSALAAACAPCRQAEQKGGGERKRLTAGLLCCHSNCLCIESIEKRFLGFGRLPVFSFPLSSFLSLPIFLPAGFKSLCASAACKKKQTQKRSIKCTRGHNAPENTGGGAFGRLEGSHLSATVQVSTCGQRKSRIRSRELKVFSPRQ